MIQRCRSIGGSGLLQDDPNGQLVRYCDHEADKAKAVAALLASEKSVWKVNRQLMAETKELRAELSEWIERAFRCWADGYSQGWHEVIIGHNCMALAERLCELGTWERKPVGENRIHYRPIEPQDAGDSDD